MRVIVAPDKFRGTATAAEVAGAVCRAASAAGWECEPIPLSDGGEGLLEAFGGPNRTSRVTGPHGRPVTAGWRLDGEQAVLEAAQANGLMLAGGAEGNDPMAATSAGVGELVAAAIGAGARRVLVGIGGSANTDGGAPVVDLLAAQRPLDGADGRVLVEVCCDVRTTFVDAARVFGPQKGASPEQLAELTRRLTGLAADYHSRFDVDVTVIPGTGAAGGLGGAFAVLGARLLPGFATIAEHLGLDDAVRRSDLVVTGEGRLDASSFHGKVVGGMVDVAERHGKPVLIVAGVVDDDVARHDAVSLVERFGAERSRADTSACIETVVADYLERAGGPNR
ncbi:MAG TPA: glycerate kinase [Jatrophihabitantaceae bacterium]